MCNGAFRRRGREPRPRPWTATATYPRSAQGAPSEQFQGDMSRNEVEIDLNKFMAMVSEIGELKAKIMEMENEREPDNPWQKWIWLSNMIDAWRIFPRAFLSVYIILLYKCTIWFMELDAPTFEQSGLISVVVGAGAAWFGLYAGTAKDKINSK